MIQHINLITTKKNKKKLKNPSKAKKLLINKSYCAYNNSLKPKHKNIEQKQNNNSQDIYIAKS